MSPDVIAVQCNSVYCEVGEVHVPSTMVVVQKEEDPTWSIWVWLTTKNWVLHIPKTGRTAGGTGFYLQWGGSHASQSWVSIGEDVSRQHSSTASPWGSQRSGEDRGRSKSIQEGRCDEPHYVEPWQRFPVVEPTRVGFSCPKIHQVDSSKLLKIQVEIRKKHRNRKMIWNSRNPKSRHMHGFLRSDSCERWLVFVETIDQLVR